MTPSLPSSPSKGLRSPVISPRLGPTDINSASSSQRKLRYTAYESPTIPPARLGHDRGRGGRSSTSLSSNRSSSRLSNFSLDKEGPSPRMSDTVTPGELTMMTNLQEMTLGYKVWMWYLSMNCLLTRLKGIGSTWQIGCKIEEAGMNIAWISCIF